MANGADTEGLARARSKETNNQQDKGARSGRAAKKLGPLASANHNPKKGGGINRALQPASGSR